ncbi:MAG: S1C family serine protease [Planctomycetota bacterium]|jgi:serine protease Do
MRKLSGYGPSLIVLGTALLVLFAGPGAVRTLTFEQTRARIIQAEHRLEQNNILEALNQAYRDIAAFVEPSVVHISAEQVVQDLSGQRAAAQSSGSGWIYDAAGHIVTNYHVIEDADRIEVQLYDGTLREAQMVGFDQFTDIAVIKIEPGHLHPAVRGEAEEPVDQGDIVFAFGSPFDFRFSMSSGVVSGKGRSVGVIRDKFGRSFGYENFIQVDAAINPGNSGGPLTDFRGRVIGMNTAIATGRRSSGGLDEGQFAGIGLAIPLDMIQPVATQLIEKQAVDKGYLGVNLGELDPHDAQDLRTLGFPGHGIVVTRVVEDGPASASGLERGDIITFVDGERIDTMDQLKSIISSMLPGETTGLTVWRFDRIEGTGETIEFHVTLGTLPTLRITGVVPRNQDRRSIEEIGILRMATCTPDLAAGYDTRHHDGVILMDIAPKSTLWLQAVPGTIVFEVAGQPVTGVEEFVAELSKHNLHRRVRLTAASPDGRVYDVYVRLSSQR